MYYFGEWTWRHWLWWGCGGGDAGDEGGGGGRGGSVCVVGLVGVLEGARRNTGMNLCCNAIPQYRSFYLSG